MSRFADARATRTVELGECACPGSPHESDWAKVRSDLSAYDIVRIRSIDESDVDAMAETYAPFISEWNLLGPNGQEWPPSAETLLSLDRPTVEAIVEGLVASILASLKLPNPSSAPSPASSRGSASRTRRTTRSPGT